MNKNPWLAKLRREPVVVPGEPVEIVITRHHQYKKGSRGCAECKGAKYAIQHIGHPPSFNAMGSGSQFTYQAMKKGMSEALLEALVQSPLSGTLKGVYVEGRVTFPDRLKRDQGNIRFIVEKALGDTLQAGGWLPDDTFFPEVLYEFGPLQATYEKNVSLTRLMLFPR